MEFVEAIERLLHLAHLLADESEVVKAFNARRLVGQRFFVEVARFGQFVLREADVASVDQRVGIVAIGVERLLGILYCIGEFIRSLL